MSTETKKMNYKERLSQSQEQKDVKSVEFKVREAKAKLALDKLATEQSIAERELALEEAKNQFPLDTKRIAQITTDLQGFNDGLKVINDLEKELFA